MKIVFVEPAASEANVYSKLHMPLLGPVYLGTICRFQAEITLRQTAPAECHQGISPLLFPFTGIFALGEAPFQKCLIPHDGVSDCQAVARA